jgi:hypothetical protein
MKRTNQDRLLDEILTADDAFAFREESLGRGLAVLRRRKQLRRGLTAAAVIALFTPLIWFLRPQRTPQWTRQSVLNAKQLPPAAPPEINFISDEQLLALFPNRSVALIGNPGHQRLLFLDDARAPSHERL